MLGALLCALSNRGSNNKIISNYRADFHNSHDNNNNLVWVESRGMGTNFQ